MISQVAACGGVLAVALSLSPRALAQRLSLDSARARAVAASAELAAVRASGEATVARARQELLREAPELDAELGTDKPFSRVEGALTYTVPLRSSAKTGALRAVLDAELQRVARDGEAAEAEVELATTRAWFRTGLLAERVRVDVDDSAAVADLADNAEHRRALGFATDLDVLRLHAEASASSRRVAADRGALAAGRVELAALLGEPAESVAAPAYDRAEMVADSSSLLLAHRSGRAAVAAAQLDVARARARGQLAHLYRWSDPRVGGSVGVQQGEPLIAAVLRIPLPARNGNRFAIAGADAELRAAQARVTAAERRATATEAQLQAMRSAAATQLALLDDDLAARRTAEQLARRRLDEGGPYLQIWLDIRRERLALEREELELVLQHTVPLPPDVTLVSVSPDSTRRGEP